MAARQNVKKYWAAINWIVDMENTEWIKDKKAIPPNTAMLVSSVFGVQMKWVIADIERTLAMHENLTQATKKNLRK